NQIFKATAPNKVWLGDMTYIPTKEGTLYLAVNNDAHFETRAEATQEIFKYIETYYNTKRMHSALDYKSPKDFEKYNS
ncbi:IS3 family transposase, partial [Lactococcus lactis]|uniref:IS3 family transposase n=1 Tax=Lactococcus lactis TaxID=1358 RepID=UPI0024185252